MGSFIMKKAKLTDEQIDQVLHYEKYLFDVLPELSEDCVFWNMRETGMLIGGETLSDSFDIEKYFKEIGIPETEYEFNT